MNLSTYAKITYALGEMYFQSGIKLDLTALANFKFPDKLNSEIVKKVLETANSSFDAQDRAAVLPGGDALNSHTTSALSKLDESTELDLNLDQEQSKWDEDQDLTRPR